MLWIVYIFTIFQFYYTSDGQIVLVPSENMTTNEKQKLSGHDEGSIRTLKAKRPDEGKPLPSQWALGFEGAPRWLHGNINIHVDTGSYGTDIMQRVKQAFLIIGAGNDYCPHFVYFEQKPTPDVGSWLHFTNPDRVRQCVHDAALDNNGEIKVVLGYDCLNIRQIVHTILHGLGFRDEITHPQRDLFVRVQWENIQPAFRSMFRIQSVETGVTGLMEYDPMSVMHFHDRAYSVNGQATIIPMLPGLQIKPSEELSHLDTMKIKRIFGHECKKRIVSKVIGNACAAWHDKLKDASGSQDSNGNRCPPSNINQIVVPGTDVKLEETNVSKDDAQAEPDQNVTVEDKTVPADEETSSAPQLVIPGKDVQTGNDQIVSHNEVDDDDGKKELTKLSKMQGKQNTPDDEAIVVGHEPS